MPYIELKTNGKIADREALKRTFGEEIRLISGKTERWLMVSLEDGCDMCFAGSSDPCAIAKVSLFGKASDADYDNLTEALCATLSEELSIPADRIYIKYEEISHWGWNGGNF